MKPRRVGLGFKKRGVDAPRGSEELLSIGAATTPKQRLPISRLLIRWTHAVIHPPLRCSPSCPVRPVACCADGGVEGGVPDAPIRRAATDILCPCAAHAQRCSAKTGLDQGLSLTPDSAGRRCTGSDSGLRCFRSDRNDGQRFDDYVEGR
jgi:hypothetical protein